MSKVKIHEFYTPSAAIHAICQEYEISQVELSKRISMSRQSVSIVVRCEHLMSDKMLEEIEYQFPKFNKRIIL